MGGAHRPVPVVPPIRVPRLFYTSAEVAALRRELNRARRWNRYQSAGFFLVLAALMAVLASWDVAVGDYVWAGVTFALAAADLACAAWDVRVARRYR